MEKCDERYERHIFICVNEKEEGKSCCVKKGGMEVFSFLKKYVVENGLKGKYKISKVKCLGHCSEGVSMVVYPEGDFYKNVSVEDVDRIVEEFLG